VATKIVSFAEGTTQSRSQVVNIPNLKAITSITVNTGTVTHSISGDNVTVNVNGGNPTRQEYNPSGYTDTKTVNANGYFEEPATGCDSTIFYSVDGYTGTLSLTSCFFNSAPTVEDPDYYKGYYSGSVSKWIDTSSFTNYYAYTVTIEYTEYEVPNAPTVISPNGGESLTGLKPISWNKSIDNDTAQNLLSYYVQLSLNNGQSWREIIAITATNTDVISLNYDFSKETETNVAKIRIRAYDGARYGPWDESDGVFAIKHNIAPSTPTNLAPGGSTIDRSIVQRLSWKHNDAEQQSKAVVEWKLQNAVNWNTINVDSLNQYVDMSSGLFPAGEIVWRVKTYDQGGLESPYSDIAIFTAANPTNAPTITAPSTAVPVARPVIQWSSVGQTVYHLQILDSLSNVVWNTGEVDSTNKAVTNGVDLLNGASYKIKVRVKDSGGIFSEFAIKDISVSYTPPPKPGLTVTAGEGCLILDTSNPLPTGTQPNLVGNDVYKKVNDEWVLVAKNVQYQYRDYAVANESIYEYKLKANGDNGTSSESEVSAGSTSFKGVWLHQITDAEGTYYQFKFDGKGRSSNWEVENARLQFAGRKYPVIVSGETEFDSVSFALNLVTPEEQLALERIVKSRDIICYRDGRGRLLFGVFTRYPVNDEKYGQSVQLEIMRIDYQEGE
jgi:hypothetical protein